MAKKNKLLFQTTFKLSFKIKIKHLQKQFKNKLKAY